MIRISLKFFYELGAVLTPVSTLRSDHKLATVWSPLFAAEKEVASLLATDWFIPAVKAAVNPGLELHAALKSITDRTDFDGDITVVEAARVTAALNAFETVLKTELHIAAAYYVSRKAGYDSDVLVSNAEQIFPSTLGVKVPAAIVDIREAGRCLAFELSTASGFHVLRGTETVARSYWKAVTSGAPFPRLKTLGTFAAKLEEAGKGNRKTVETLKQISSLHRNPLMHPNESLDLEEAIGLFGICCSGISAMLKEIPNPPTGVLSSMVP
jgi:hypothetical protein